MAAVAVAGAVALVAWMVAYGLCGERMVRLGGMHVQLLGFGIVAYGILSKTKLFRNHGLWRPLADWWERRPRLCRRIDLAMNPTVNMTMSAGNLMISHKRVEPDAPLDIRITAVEKNVDMLFNEIGGLGIQVRTNATTATAAIRGEQSKRETEYANAQRQLDEAIVGKIHWEVSGVALFVLGIIAGTASPEISWMLGTMSSCSLPS